MGSKFVPDWIAISPASAACELCKLGASGDGHFEIRFEPTASNGTAPAVVAPVTDLTECKKAELDSPASGDCRVFGRRMGKDLNSITSSRNRCAEQIFGNTADKMLDTSITRLIPPDPAGRRKHHPGKNQSRPKYQPL
jgi:uncharacterized protein (DUF1810 family)